MKITIFEGTQQEFQLVYPMLRGEGATHGKESSQLDDAGPVADVPPANVQNNGLTEQVAVAFLTRRPLTSTQKAVMKHVFQAGEAGITSSELAQLIGCDPGTVKSNMRLFGKRAAHTEGWPSDVETFNRVWEGSQNRYRLHPAFRAVLQKRRVVL